jgi:hypothetical protein
MGEFKGQRVACGDPVAVFKGAGGHVRSGGEAKLGEQRVPRSEYRRDGSDGIFRI